MLLEVIWVKYSKDLVKQHYYFFTLPTRHRSDGSPVIQENLHTLNDHLWININIMLGVLLERIDTDVLKYITSTNQLQVFLHGNISWCVETILVQEPCGSEHY